MPDIDPRWIDVDFEKEDKFVFGHVEPDDSLARSLRAGTAFEDAVPVMTESELRAAAERLDDSKGGLEYMVTQIYDQGGEGSCVANAGGQAHEIIQAKTLGRENVTHLSAISMYDFIGRSPGSGAMVGDCLDEGKTRGWIPVDNEVNKKRFNGIVHPPRGFKTKRVPGWEEVAASFRYGESYIVKSVAGLLTAGMMGFSVVVGRRGHSICYTRGVWSNGWKMPYPNSWGDWGQGFGDMTTGFGFDSPGNISSSSNWAYAITSIIVPKWYTDMLAAAKGQE